MGYWDKVLEYWVKAEAAADLLEPAELAAMKPMHPLSVYSTTPVAITGLRGAGKTVLYDALLGRVGVDYRPTGRSGDVEAHRSVIKASDRTKRRVNARVIPGDQSPERTNAFRRDFGRNGRRPAGIIHVVCSGYNRVWESHQRQAIKADLAATGKPVSLAEIRVTNRDKELSDFKETCGWVKDAWGRRSGSWLIIAVAKCDLFWEDPVERGAARDYYIPGSGAESAFCAVLRDLIEYVGESNCERLAVVPFACYAETYTFESGITQGSKLQSAQFSAVVNNFRALVGDFCARS